MVLTIHTKIATTKTYVNQVVVINIIRMIKEALSVQLIHIVKILNSINIQVRHNQIYA